MIRNFNLIFDFSKETHKLCAHVLSAARVKCALNVTQDDSKRRFSAQHSVAMLEQCCNHLKQCRNNAVMLCFTKIVVANRLV